MKTIFHFPLLAALTYVCVAIITYAALSFLLSFLNGTNHYWVVYCVIAIYCVMASIAESIPLAVTIGMVLKGQIMLMTQASAIPKFWGIFIITISASVAYIATRIISVPLLVFVSGAFGIK